MGEDRLEGEFCSNCRFFVAPVTCTRRPRLAQKHDDKTRHDLWCWHYERKMEVSDPEPPVNVFTEADEVTATEASKIIQETARKAEMLTPDNPGPFTEFINQPPKVYPEPSAPPRVQKPGEYNPEDAGTVLLELNILKSDLERQMMAMQGSLASTQAFHKSVVVRIEAVTKMQHQ